MTENEAVEKLEAHIECESKRSSIEGCNEGCIDCELSYLQGTSKEHIESVKLAIQALEKQIPKKAEHKVIKCGKHKWRKDENGEIDEFAFDYDYHNGVVCEICGKAVCVHCEPDYDKLEDCEDDYYICPTCGDKFHSKREYCSCGQHLDWRDEE